MTDRYDIITDQVKKLGFDLFFYVSTTKISLASSEIREWKSGLTYAQICKQFAMGCEEIGVLMKDQSFGKCSLKVLYFYCFTSILPENKHYDESSTGFIRGFFQSPLQGKQRKPMAKQNMLPITYYSSVDELSYPCTELLGPS